MYVTVYTIAKNEEKHVERFMASAKEADAIVVLDTGSEDGTVAKLRELGATVYEETIYPWRFDVARNRSLELIPPETDVCVCFDLDEILTAGWRAALEAAWVPGRTERAEYKYIWSWNADGTPGVTFNREKIHAPGVYKWTHPVHEVLARLDGRHEFDVIYIPDFVCEHHPDDTKSRANYLPLLKLSTEEDPDDDRNAHYLGREYMYRGDWRAAITELKRHLSLPRATWDAERCASMRFIGRCYNAMGEQLDELSAAQCLLRTEALRWFGRAAFEAPQLREGWFEAAKQCSLIGDKAGALFFGSRGLEIKKRVDSGYIQEAEPWGGLLEEIVEWASDG